MKILLVGYHNTHSLNWGLRGTSIALTQLLEKKFEEINLLSSKYYDIKYENFGVLNNYITSEIRTIYSFIKNKKRKNILFKSMIRLSSFAGISDYITENPQKSVEKLLQCKQRSQELNYLYKSIIISDIVVINGEGSCVFKNPVERNLLFYLMIIELSAKLNKPVFWVNGMIADCPYTGRNELIYGYAKNSFKKLSGISLRDSESYKYVNNEFPSLPSTMIPDALFSWYNIYHRFGKSILPENGDFIIPFPEYYHYFNKIDFNRNYICVGAGAATNSDQKKGYDVFCSLISKLMKLDYQVLLIHYSGNRNRFINKVRDEFNLPIIPVETSVLMAGAVLANAKLLISGWYHASIFASLGGTPTIFLNTNSHKIRSLMDMIGYVDESIFSAFPDNIEIENIYELAKTYLENETTIRGKIKGVVSQLSKESHSLPDYIYKSINRN